MKISFAAAPAANARVIARLVNQDALPADLEPAVVEGARSTRFSGKSGQVFEAFVPREGSVVRLVLLGGGEAGDAARLANLEKAGAALTARLLTSGETSATVDFAGSAASANEVAALLLGTRLRAWRHDGYRTTMKDEQKPSLAEIIAAGAPAGAEEAWQDAFAVAQGVEFTRELVTEPGNVIYPESFVHRCIKRFEGTGLAVSVLDETEMQALGMGALLGVGQGSARPPRLLVIEWNGGGDARKTAFVGKGVTFDTGGISLKPGPGMEDMKWDMGGAGAVAGTMLTLALRKAKANIVAVCGLVENMPDGNAQRPGDVVRTMSGQTVEVINTDAEGRLVLCDALTWVQKNHSPAAVIDLATLTGAIIATLAHEYAGIFTNDDALAEKLTRAGNASGDRLWRLPMGPAYDKMIDSPIADMKNMGAKFAGSITAAQFLQRFIEKGTPWAHLDIAGMVWADKPGATWDKGATGYGVRLLDRFVRDSLES
ncbi:leucyl aminopeptidase [Novosphingobium sp. TH158]|uniref:leucyl aminopeptidase n=1 Tax=Novosphingobium sp. TH158 TaxID=2067455 RepID=UPI000C7D27F6|nr:leucyl aminopeptidase [Novosphingobium sp. TH158]PLK26081.1 leucyl aminopeptidase [Novosphingobium sp. TH158]